MSLPQKFLECTLRGWHKFSFFTCTYFAFRVFATSEKEWKKEIVLLHHPLDAYKKWWKETNFRDTYGLNISHSHHSGTVAENDFNFWWSFQWLRKNYKASTKKV